MKKRPIITVLAVLGVTLVMLAGSLYTWKTLNDLTNGNTMNDYVMGYIQDSVEYLRGHSEIIELYGTKPALELARHQYEYRADSEYASGRRIPPDEATFAAAIEYLEYVFHMPDDRFCRVRLEQNEAHELVPVYWEWTELETDTPAASQTAEAGT